jgi:hypothetical protein
MEPWQRVFQNLRSSRETELVEDFPVHVVTDWIGNSPDVAKMHYLQTHEQHFGRAAGKSCGTGGGQNLQARSSTAFVDATCNQGGVGAQPLDAAGDSDGELVGAGACEISLGTPKGSRTPLSGMRTRCPSR